MNNTDNLYADATMMIRRPVAEVFEAIVNPEITTLFWYTKSTGRMVPKASIIWSWEMYDVHVPVNILEFDENERIVMQWGDDQDNKVEWIFKVLSEEKTLISVVNTGFKGDCDALISGIRDSTGGFTMVLSALKAWLEHGIVLTVVKDKNG